MTKVPEKIIPEMHQRPIEPLDADTRAAIREGLGQARRADYLPDAEIEALWKRHGITV
jgi:hypothetical protein